ncbi:piggyBac transposable element-derived protein 2 isoform X1 [Cherax quadricarinatus]|uniref:piggyBac transposable element-derived protein 2 isoform X1 n=2 Tax=Cherax quadricarinatus TaxID=27406 RepID=UPI00387E5E99
MPVKRYRRDQSEVSCCLKYVIFGFNVIFWLMGLSILAIGVWAWTEKDTFNNLSRLTNIALDPAFVLIVTGLITFTIGFTGCVGALRENTCLLACFHERLFYGEQSTSRSRYICVSEDSDSEPEVDEPELLDSGDEYLPTDAQDAEMSTDDEEEREERPAKKQKVMRKKKTFRIEEYPDEEEIHENIALQVSSEWTVDDIENDPLPAYEHEKPLAIRSPYEYFRMFVTPAMIDNIVYQTNLYTRQQDVNSTFSTDSEEIMRFIGILLFMGINSLPSLEDYWKAGFRSQQVAESMASKRFRYLRSHIHFNDNTKKDNDRFYKVRPLYTELTNACLKIPATPKQSIDEVMVGFKGKTAGNLRQYIKTKPDKWGFKLFCRASQDGLIHDILMYQGTTTFDTHPIQLPQEECKLPISTKIVLVLAQTMNKTNTSAIYADNFFSSMPLVKLLRDKYNCRYTGTVRDNRCGKPHLVPIKQMEKNSVVRGNFCFNNNDGVLVVRWKDTKVVTLVTTDIGVEPMSLVERYNKGTKRKEKISCPAVIKNYNANMGGIDKSNMLVHLYKTPMKSKRWYMRLFAYIIDLAVVNAWVLYCRDSRAIKQKCMQLKYFRNSISEIARSKGQNLRGSSLRTTPRPSPTNSPCTSNGVGIVKPGRGTRAELPDDSVRKDMTLMHFPMAGQRPFTCKYCSTSKKTVTSSFVCSVCKVNLCIKTDRNCFTDFHLAN